MSVPPESMAVTSRGPSQASHDSQGTAELRNSPLTLKSATLSRGTYFPRSRRRKLARTGGPVYPHSWRACVAEVTLILTSENHLEKRLWLFISISWPYRYLGGENRVKTVGSQIGYPWGNRSFFSTARSLAKSRYLAGLLVIVSHLKTTRGLK